MSNLKLSDEYVPNVDYHFDRVDKRKPIKFDDLMEELCVINGGYPAIHVLILRSGELPDPVESVDVYDTGMAAKLLAECNAQYLIDGQGNVIAGDKYRFKEMMLRKWKGEEPHGHWNELTVVGKPYLECSVCGHGAAYLSAEFQYCPNCGAKMDGGAT